MARSPGRSRPKSSLRLDFAAGLSRGQAVYEALRDALRSGVYRPGDRLREEDVARQLDVSRTPVREALGKLLAKGFVRQSPGRGLVVRSLDTSEVLELYAMREILEGAAAGLAARHASQAELDALADIEAAYESHAGDTAELARLNLQFHAAIFRAARNRFLDGALQELQDAIALLGPTTHEVEGRIASAAAEHRKILTAIGEHDAEAAEAAARVHIRESLRARLRMLQG